MIRIAFLRQCRIVARISTGLCRYSRNLVTTEAQFRDVIGSPNHRVLGKHIAAMAMVDAGKLDETPEEMQALIDRDTRERLY